MEIFIQFHKCNRLQVYGLTIVDTPKNHISINGCSDVMLHHLTLVAPGTSPNTDGIDISDSTRIQILDSFIGTGDDCIAINGGSSYINITNLACGPGHGISIGSLGAHGAYDTVENVFVKNCKLTGTTNGVRIKTWQDAVIVSNITYRRLYGTCSTKDAIVLKCSNVAPCTGITMDNVDIITEGCHATCINVQGKATSTTPLVTCLKKEAFEGHIMFTGYMYCGVNTVVLYAGEILRTEDHSFGAGFQELLGLQSSKWFSKNLVNDLQLDLLLARLTTHAFFFFFTTDLATTLIQHLQQMQQQIQQDMEIIFKQFEDRYSATSKANSDDDATSAEPDFIDL
ncbi:hypothetical protein Scep_019188 [Stephania cephalantha]|uniref:Polygalacturonase n=1 Tax=Stephania cephalantha TaxID=152367 RepID=A0AAP0NMM3_9MAGN